MDIIQLSASFVSIILLSLLVYALFPAPKRLEKSAVTDEFIRYASNVHISDVLISTDNQAALVLTEGSDREIGLVARLGDKLCSRLIPVTADLKWCMNEDTLTFDCNDFTYPNLVLKLSENDLAKAREFLEASAKVGDPAHAE